RLWGSASVMRTWAISPVRSRPAASKFTTRLQRVRPLAWVASLREAPSTRISISRPTRRPLRAAPTRTAAASTRVVRSPLHAALPPPPAQPPPPRRAPPPGRREHARVALGLHRLGHLVGHLGRGRA